MKYAYNYYTWRISKAISTLQEDCEMKLILVLVLLTALLLVFAPVSALAQETSQPPWLCPNVGSYLQDDEHRTREQAKAAIEALQESMPGLDCVSFAMYLDYPDTVRAFFEEAHAAGMTVQYRTAGFNSCKAGTNESTGGWTPEQHLLDIKDWINANYEMLKPGDAMEVAVDEVSNCDYWHTGQFTNGVGTNDQTIEEFNNFLQQAITVSREAFDAHGLEDVIVEIYHDSPAVIDVLDQDTLEMLEWVGFNSYPECGEPVAQTAQEAADRMIEELDSWAVDYPMVITFGPNPCFEYDDATQAEAYALYLDAIEDEVPNLVGLSPYQFGDESNGANSRLFDWQNGQWVARPAVEEINQFFTNWGEEEVCNTSSV